MPTRTRWALVVFALAVHALAFWRGQPQRPGPARAFQVQPPTPPTGGTPFFLQEFIETAPAAAQVHVASLCELPSGRLAACWYGGSREGAQDVAVWYSVRLAGPAGAWSEARPIVTRESAALELRRYVKKIGNAVLFSNERGQLWLLYVSVAAGGWSGSALNLKTSADGGQSWTPSQRLTLSPLFNMGTLVRGRPAALGGNDWAVPIYHELVGEFPEMLWLSDSPRGSVVTTTRAFGGRTAFQPSLVPLDARRALLVCRDTGGLRRVSTAATTDGGLHWSSPRPTALPNPNSGLDALRLHDGRLLLALNDSETARDRLSLAVSDDQGETWSLVATLEAQDQAEFSYPFQIQASDGTVHLVYTWKRQRIKHVAFNGAWLDEQRKARTR